MMFAMLALLALAGCYASDTPLITPDHAAFPYQSITYTRVGEAVQLTIAHQGDAYVSTDDRNFFTDVVFQPVSGPYYVAQFHVNSEGNDGYLYGLVKVDAATNTALVYALFADAKDVGPGLPACGPDPRNGVCLTGLQPYIDHAMTIATRPGALAAVYSLDLK
jgi:hypothetical protein